MIRKNYGFNGKTIAVTGASGYLGSALVDRLLDSHCFVLRITRDRNRLRPLPKKIAGVQDLESAIDNRALWDRVFREYGTNLVFHFAAQTSAYSANNNLQSDFYANVMPVIQMLESCRGLVHQPLIIAAGAATQVGMTRTVPTNETAVDNPITIYDIHKLAAERYIKHFTKLGVIKGIVLRLTNVYGPGVESSSCDRGILNKVTKAAIKGEPISIFGAGNEVRDYIYISDAVEAFFTANQYADTLSGQQYLIGSGVPHSLSEAFRMVAKHVEKTFGKPVPVVHSSWPPHTNQIEYRNFCADIKAFKNSTHWAPEIDLATGIEKTISAFSSLPN
ncbi:MAG: hypothetical protein CBB68_06480 [Rhodospirillaceae bacterium TMED8]|nr:hypothetical protein [Magnetovibrio sp.]OUT51262.1 MAG: hypothetical protein CBB68_06480 [Rhodospirillaceae bacterium TMED8]|tara:strand:- start:11104 stop:12102 length:999 start_codon:yes stop_codon:yes gene_type:complete